MEFSWLRSAKDYKIEGNSILMEAGKGTDLFNSPSETFKCQEFPYYYLNIKGDFIFRCIVSVDFRALYDLGGLIVYENENKWIKFAYENSDVGCPAIVSVVTDKYSDDCNGAEISGNVWMQISRKKDVFALHYSKDKVNWILARIFYMNMKEEVKVGVSAQCPLGESCTASFKEIEVLDNNYENVRKSE